MAKLRRWKSQRAIEEKLPKGGMKQVRATHQLGDLHGGVIDHDRELIGRDVVFSPDDEVAKVDARDRALRSGDLIEKLQRFFIWDTETPVRSGWIPGRRNR